VVLLASGERVSTERARRALSSTVPREDATFDAARAALLVLALTDRPHLLAAALRDRLHQEQRLALAPRARSLFHTLQTDLVPVCVAGSGPTLLAFETDDLPVPEPGPGWRSLRLEIDRRGANVLDGGQTDR
jgi:homoserine kinase